MRQYENLILMCQDVPVYDLDTGEILNKEYCPVLVQGKRFLDWIKNRTASKTNQYARHYRNSKYKNKSSAQINILSNSISLSDSYWIKNNILDKNTSWDKINPYRNKKQVEPTVLKIAGFKNKKWINSKCFLKEDSIEDHYAYKYCKLLGMDVQGVTILKEGSKDVIIKNFTSNDFYLEPAEQSELGLYGDYFDEDVINLYSKQLGYSKDIADMYFIDVLLYNTDRHLGNFGLLKPTPSNTLNHNIYFSPLYDFDCTFDLDESEGSYKDTSMNILLNSEILKYKNTLIDYCNIVLNQNDNQDLYMLNIIKKRAENIKQLLISNECVKIPKVLNWL